ncbi:MAG TPA: FtsX-like permease family protein [Thermoanaerobaculia bacterium]
MSTLWRKAVRDFWSERGRALLVILAIAAGVAAFSAMLSSYAILVRALDEGYLATNPAAATFWTDRVDDALIAGVRANTPVTDTEGRRSVRGRIQTGPMQWKTLQLFVVEDYGDIRISVLKPQAGAWPPKTGQILVERDAMQVAKKKIGERATVRFEGGERVLLVAGTVHDVGQAQARMENLVYGYTNLETLALLGEEPYLDQLKVAIAGDEARIREVAEEVRAYLERTGHPVRGMDVPKPGKHPHADLMGTLMLSISSFGVFILLLSGILVVNLLTAILAAEVRQIGVMKAVGGTRGQIARIYFAQAFLLGVAAVIVAIPLGMWGARLLCIQQARFLNFDIASFSVPWWVYAADAAVGILVPLLAAAVPVWRGTSVSVREALADYGVGSTRFGSGALDRMLANVRGLARPALFAIRNSFRRRGRLVLTVTTLAAGGLFFLSALNVRSSLINTLDALFAQRKYDLSVSFPEMVSAEAIERAVAKTEGIRASEMWITGEIGLEKGESRVRRGPHRHEAPAGRRISAVAVPATTKLLVPVMAEGRWFQQGEVEALVVNSALAERDPRMRVGNSVDVQLGPAKLRWTVVGIVREPFVPPVAYLPRELYDQRHLGSVNNLRLVVENEGVRARLEENLRAEGLRVGGSVTNADTRIGFDQHMLMLYVFLMVVSAIIAGVGALGLTTTMSLNVLERRREMGVLRAIGATPRAIRLIVAAEGAVIGIVSWLAASLLAWPVSKVVGDSLVRLMFRGGLDFVFVWPAVAIWLVVVLVLSIAASVIPAWHASRGSVREALAYE